jgi:hypothetical protein
MFRNEMIRLASGLPEGSIERRSLLFVLASDNPHEAAEKWIPKDLEKGRCTPAPNPDCPVGSPQYNLAQTFKEHPEWGEKGRKTQGKTAKDLPPDVERYVEEGKAQGMDEGKAWAVAWSRYCKYKNPGSPHCQKDKGDYFPGRQAAAPKEARAPSKLESQGIMFDLRKQLGDGTRAYFEKVLEMVQAGQLAPSAVVGGGYKNNKRMAIKWLQERISRSASEVTLRRSLIRLASTMPKGDRTRQELLHLLASEPAGKVASKPINPQVNRRSVADGMAFMTYRVDASASAQGTSKFYEGFIEPRDGGYAFVRMWGALTDKATPKNTRTKVVVYPDLAGAQRDLSREKAKRIKRKYTDAFGPNHRNPETGKALRKGQYPLGLYRPGVGFGWGTEEAAGCSVTLRTLRDKVVEAIGAIMSNDPVSEIEQDVNEALVVLERGEVDDRTTASSLRKRLQLVLRRLSGQGRFLPDPEQKRLRGDLVWVRNFIETQTAFCP